MKKKYPIQVRRTKADGSVEVVETIRRTLRGEAIGNFNPLFCSYKDNKRVLVHSDEGDLSDPFRFEESYLEKLYIKEEDT